METRAVVTNTSESDPVLTMQPWMDRARSGRCSCATDLTRGGKVRRSGRMEALSMAVKTRREWRWDLERVYDLMRELQESVWMTCWSWVKRRGRECVPEDMERSARDWRVVSVSGLVLVSRWERDSLRAAAMLVVVG